MSEIRPPTQLIKASDEKETSVGQWNEISPKSVAACLEAIFPRRFGPSCPLAEERENGILDELSGVPTINELQTRLEGKVPRFD